ncbi:2-oxoglutarate and iron-dependent oxygenase domain-containing protein [Mesorhizobium sp. KR9-304]|uniref:isopenicillin N synthase family dioxygenase n=1 Tax=Mesorhizobium sp. KR9-304 TaxID=3156614 RepID=UPI0032B452B8
MSSSDIPLIDVSPLATGEARETAGVAARIGAACRDIGFFYVAGHSVPPSLVSKAFAMSATFFDRDEVFKRSVLYTAEGNRGYVPMKGEALDPTRPADLKEAFNIGLELPSDDPDLLAGQMFRANNLWPKMAGFRDTMLAYFDACQGLGRLLHRAFAVDLGLAPDFFEDKIDRPMAVLRLLHYPPAPGRTEVGQLGAGEHTDYGCVTLLATDGVGGLEVRTRAGEWLKAPHVPGAFVCNIGDCLMRWTNDIYVSTPHRVVSPSGRERYSIAFFLDPNPDADIACLPNCATAARPARYAPIRGDAFLASRLSPTYEKSGLGEAPCAQAKAG